MADNTTVQRSYQAHDETLLAMAELKAAFRLTSDSAVIRRALGLARLIAREAKDDHTIMIERKDGTQVKLLLDA
jgi:hypothetical protein